VLRPISCNLIHWDDDKDVVPDGKFNILVFEAGVCCCLLFARVSLDLFFKCNSEEVRDV